MADPEWAVHLPAGMAPGDYDPTARRSLPAAWAQMWTAEPAREVLHDPARGWVSAGWLEEASRRAAGRFAAAGLTPGDRVLFSTGSSIDLVVAYVAALRSGLVPVPTNTAYTEREVAHVVGDARPRAAVVDDGARAGWIRTADAEVVITGPDVDLADGPEPTLDDPEPAAPAQLGYTSGTTGAPKGAVLTHANLLANNEALALAWRWTAEDRLVLALPLFHAHGLCVGLCGTLLAGASAVLLPAFTEDAVLDAARDHAATLFFGVPTMYHRLARSPRVAELGRLRLCVSGSAPLPADLHGTLGELTGQAVLERYGLTETNMDTSNPHDGERRAGTVGLALPGVDVRLDGEAGEIEVRGPNVFAGYWERPEATAEAFTVDGWFRTGDLGARDAEGYLRVLGRSKELIITGGYNVYPREVEDVLLTHPDVAEVAVVGLASEEWGETVTAFVVPAGDRPDADALLAHAAEGLARYKQPRVIHFVDALPRNALGKVLKQELRG